MYRENGANMEEVVIRIPKKYLYRLRIPIRENLEKRLKIELALRLYEKGWASSAIAARIAGMSRIEFLELLAQEKIPIQYRKENLEEDLRVVEEFEEEAKGSG